MGRGWRKIFLFLAVSLVLELMVWNARALFSLGATQQHPEYFQEGNSVYITGMTGKPKYLYLGMEGGENGTVTVSLWLRDEGNAEYYELPQVTLYPPIEKSRYLRLHSYGQVKDIRVDLSGNTEGLRVSEVIYDAKVPWFVSIPRILAVFALICLVWGLRPGSALYSFQWKKWQKRLVVGVLLSVNIVFLLILVRSNPAFLEPLWPYHQQYHRLAVALTQGKVSIDVGDEKILDVLGAMQNPYDYEQRQAIEEAGQVWDTCYYKGHFYVYFGIVPVLLFYLPWYLFFHTAFPTWLGVFLTGAGILAGVYYFLGKVRRRWFPESPYVWYLILAVIMGNSMNLPCAMLHADFYYLPILMALAFSLWGLGLILEAAERWNFASKRDEREPRGKNGKIVPRLLGGGLCLALTAGCRPQFLVGSFLMFPILWQQIRQSLKNGAERKGLVGKVLALALPYGVVAAGLMYYNWVRFGSVFDFGASYNLTTNDMTHRGMELGRLPDGFFMYLFQPLSLGLRFPFAEVTAFYSNYLGKTVRDWTYGGAFWTHPLLLGMFGIFAAKRGSDRKGLKGTVLTSLALALIVIAADTEMAGILNRYYTDFLWLLMIPAVLTLFQMEEELRRKSTGRWLLVFVLLAGAFGIIYELCTAFRGSGIMNDNVHRYYIIQSFFQ